MFLSGTGASLSDIALSSPTSGLSVSCWLRYSAAPGAATQFWLYNGVRASDGYGFAVIPASNRILVHFGGRGNVTTATYTLPTQRWAYVTVEMTGSGPVSLTVYENGVLREVTSLPSAPLTPSGTLWVGKSVV